MIWCWHRRVTWPLKRKDRKQPYQVCLDCGKQRVYDLDKGVKGRWGGVEDELGRTTVFVWKEER